MTLASMFHMRHWTDTATLHPVPRQEADQYRVLLQAINNAPPVEMLAEEGYRIASIGSPMVSTVLLNAHEFDSGPYMNSFEVALLERSILAAALETVAPGLLLDQQREHIAWTLDAVLRVAERTERESPYIVHAHLMSPHPPFLFDASGGEVPLPPCYPDRCRMWWPERHALGMTDEEFAAGMRGQVAHLNAVLVTLDQLIQAQPNAAVILMSDHGSRHDPTDPTELSLNFFAACTPDRQDVFPGDVSPVNVFPALFTNYFGKETRSVGYKAWLSDSASPLDVMRTHRR